MVESALQRKARQRKMLEWEIESLQRLAEELRGTEQLPLIRTGKEDQTA
jgi:hypothetical protein